MPSLRLFGKPTFFAGDDLRWFVSTSFLLRFIQLVLVLPVFARYFAVDAFAKWPDIRKQCFVREDVEDPTWFGEEAHLTILLYLSMSLVLAIAGMIWAVSTFVYSSRGTPTNSEPREAPLKFLCHCHLTFTNFFRLACVVWGSMALYVLELYCECTQDYEELVALPVVIDGEPLPPPTPQQFGAIPTTSRDVKEVCGENSGYTACFVGLFITHLIDFCAVVATAAYFGCKWIPLTKWISWMTCLSRECGWNICCRLCFVNLSCMTCCLHGGAQASMTGDLSDFAALMAKYFGYHEYLDATVSDTFAALVMLKRLHLQQEMESKQRLAQEALEQARAQQLEHEQSGGAKKKGLDGRHKLRFELLSRIVESSRQIPLNLVSTQGGAREVEKVAQTWTTGQSVMYIRQEVDKEDEESLSQSSSDNIEKSDQRQSVIARSAIRNRRIRDTNVLVPQFRQALNMKNEYELLLLAEGARFIHHAEAIYFWATLKKARNYYHKGILEKLGVLKKIQKNVDTLLLDHARQCLKLASIPGVNPSDVEYSQSKQSLNTTPYVVVADHAWKSLVISIRGTDSLEDLLTDVSLRPVELSKQGEKYGFDGQDKYCHRGVLGRVEWIYEDLKQNAHLDKLLTETTSEDGETREAKYSGYRLRVTGHSLGAACAALLTLLLKSEYPRVRCSAFSPPGCSVCETLGQEMSNYVTSYILDTDVIGRSSVEGFLGIRDELLEMVARIKIPKYQVLRSGARKEKGGRIVPLEEFNQRAICSESEVDQENSYVKKLRKFYEMKRSEADRGPKLYPPGRIIQMFRTINLPGQNLDPDVDVKGRGCCCSSGRNECVNDEYNAPYTARWAEREDFGRIVLSSHFISDHETSNVKGQLHLLAKRAGLQEPFTTVGIGDDPSAVVDVDEEVGSR